MKKNTLGIRDRRALPLRSRPRGMDGENGMGRKLLHLLNGLITCAVVIALAAAGAYAGYALWDNQQIYDAAENAHSEMKEMRASLGMPTTVSAMEELLEENRKAREELRAAAATLAAAATKVPAAEKTPAITETPVITVNPDDAAAKRTPPSVTPVPAVSVAEGAPATVPSGTDIPPVQAAVLTTTPAPFVTPVPTEIPAATAIPAPTATPAPTEEPEKSLLDQLKGINQDITAWLTLPGTAIDYPVLQGSSNYSYINTDVHGNFALAGSIFLDYRNSGDYTDLYSLLYGHNMSQHRMFSDINLFKEEKFFNENTLGMMLTEDGWHIIESLAVIVLPASDSGMFNPENWKVLEGEEIYRTAQENAMFTCEEGLKALREQLDAGEKPRLISLSTCSDEFTDARTILLTLMDP